MKVIFENHEFTVEIIMKKPNIPPSVSNFHAFLQMPQVSCLDSGNQLVLIKMVLDDAINNGFNEHLFRMNNPKLLISKFDMDWLIGDFFEPIPDRPGFFRSIMDVFFPRSTTDKKKQADLIEFSTPSFPEPLKDQTFAKAWAAWERYLTERKIPLKPTVRSLHLKKLAEMGLERALIALEYSMNSQYRAPFEPTYATSKSTAFGRINNPRNQTCSGSNEESTADLLKFVDRRRSGDQAS